jgi:DNA mismatch repair protein MSH2
MKKWLLVSWKAEVDGKGLSKSEQVEKLRSLVASNPQLLENPFFQRVKAL